MSDKSRFEETVELITFFLLLPLVTASGVLRIIKMRKDLQLPKNDIWKQSET
jgi:hypothetical protein